MRFATRTSRSRDDRITLNLASMIDVTFLLLAYFMFTMAILAQEDHLSPTIKTVSEEAAQTSDFQPQRVEVLVLDGAPAYRLGERVMRSRGELAGALEPLPRTVGVFIDVNDGVPVGFAVAAIQLARDAGFEQVTYVPTSDH